jgi:hypothetical protein
MGSHTRTKTQERPFSMVLTMNMFYYRVLFWSLTYNVMMSTMFASCTGPFFQHIFQSWCKKLHMPFHKTFFTSKCRFHFMIVRIRSIANLSMLLLLRSKTLAICIWKVSWHTISHMVFSYLTILNLYQKTSIMTCQIDASNVESFVCYKHA